MSPLDSKLKDDSKKGRVIVDLSFPKGSSVNSGISKHHFLGQSVRCEFPKFDHLVDLIRLKAEVWDKAHDAFEAVGDVIKVNGKNHLCTSIIPT